jgi:hypothetical protein
MCGLVPHSAPIRSLLQKLVDQQVARARYEDSLNAGMKSFNVYKPLTPSL